MSILRLASLPGLLAVTLMLDSCAHFGQKRVPKPAPPQVTSSMFEWGGDGIAGPASIRIYLDIQKAFFYRGEQQVGWSYIASGKPSHPTPPGDFHVLEKKEDKTSNLYGVLLDANGDVLMSDFNTAKDKDKMVEGTVFKPARMPFFMRLSNDGVGMHAGPIPKPGATASHGCIRMPSAMATKFYQNVQVGTPVTIFAQSPPELLKQEAERKKLLAQQSPKKNKKS